MKITVTRFDPSQDASPYEQSFEVPYRDNITALEALMHIYENEEPIAFDSSCHGRSCGRCAMMVDGEPKLACITPLTDGAHDIAPLEGYPVLHDLIVDKTQRHLATSARYNRVRFDDMNRDEINQFDMGAQEKVYSIEWCTRCGRCSSVCPAMQTSADYVGPMTMLATAYRYYDPYDQADRVVQAVQDGLYRCILCGQCTEVCDSPEIDHLTYWNDLRAAAEQRGLKPRYAK